MSEHNWQFGDWGREKASRLIVRFISQSQQSWWLFRDGSFGADRECEHLPHCDGFDWKPIDQTPNEPGEGYRFVDRDTEQPQNGDGANGMPWEVLFRDRKFLNDDGTTEPCGVKQ